MKEALTALCPAFLYHHLTSTTTTLTSLCYVCFFFFLIITNDPNFSTFLMFDLQVVMLFQLLQTF